MTDSLLEWARAVELWHSQPDRGLAFRFMAEPTPASLPLKKEQGQTSTIVVEAAGFLAKVRFPLPDSDHRMHTTAYDQTRRVLSVRWQK